MQKATVNYLIKGAYTTEEINAMPESLDGLVRFAKIKVSENNAIKVIQTTSDSMSMMYSCERNMLENIYISVVSMDREIMSTCISSLVNDGTIYDTWTIAYQVAKFAKSKEEKSVMVNITIHEQTYTAHFRYFA